MKYPRVSRFVREMPWAILHEKLEQILTFLRDKNIGLDISQELMEKRIAEAQGHVPQLVRPAESARIGPLAIIPVMGVISPRINIMTEISGATSTERLTATLREAVESTDVSTIVLDINSPGGAALGMPEMAAEILKARETKPVVAVANHIAASAAFWIAAAASEVVVTPSGQVGSIGVFMTHEDVSAAMEKEGVKVSFISAGKFKTEGNPFEPLSDEARTNIQSTVDEIFGMFIADVAKGRGITVRQVKSDFGQGRMVTAKAAKAAGMVDRIATLDDTIIRLLKGSRKGRSGARAEFGTIREFEAFLRDEGGLSNTEAKRFASRGFSASDLREGDDSEAELAKALREIEADLR